MSRCHHVQVTAGESGTEPSVSRTCKWLHGPDSGLWSLGGDILFERGMMGGRGGLGPEQNDSGKGGTQLGQGESKPRNFKGIFLEQECRLVTGPVGQVAGNGAQRARAGEMAPGG